MKPLKLLATVITLLSSVVTTPALASTWIFVGFNVNDTAWYYDLDTIMRNENLVTVWEKHDHSQDKTEKARESKVLSRYHCINRTRTIISSTTYYPNGKVEKTDIPYYAQSGSTISPDSMGEAMMKAVCSVE